MARSRIGPLALEAPLGGKSSSVFRAVHMQQRLQLAVRIFSVPMGMTPEAKTDFAKQMEALKTLRHPGIVRCFGGGFDQRDAYLVYELIDGESLEALLQRRDRLPWETVLAYGLQLCDALHAAHSTKWLHGRLRPDKLVVTRDGESIKILDFRRDTSAANMLGAMPSIDQIAYQSPEALDGLATESSDLYSLGAILYRMMTGTPPLVASTVAEMKNAVKEQLPAPVTATVFDCPVWMSSIVEQLLQKRPEIRPYSAESVGMALREAQKRAEQGFGVAQHAVSGFSALQLKVDRSEAEKVLGRKRKKRRERPENEDATPFTEKPWFIVLCLVVLGLSIGWWFLPLNEATLRRRAETLIATDELTDMNDARDKYLLPLLERFPDGKHAEWAKEKLEEIAMMNAERKLERDARFGRDPDTEGERRFLEARRYESFGDRVSALAKYKAIVNLLKEVEKERPMVNLARRQIQRIEERPPSMEELREFLKAKLGEAESYFTSGDVLSAKTIWESIVNLYNGNEEMKAIVVQAQGRLDQFKRLAE
jgi:eukaryotic-like serine/threonine-protein kinase